MLGAMVYSSFCITLCLYCAWDMEEVALQAGVRAWVLFLIYFALHFGWVVLLAIVVAGYVGYLNKDWGFMGLMVGYGVKLLSILYVVTFFLAFWFF